MHELPPPRQLMVIRFGAMGDIIHALPSLAWANQHAPNTQFHWLTAPNNLDLISPLAERLGLNLRLWAFDPHAHPRAWWRLAQQIHQASINTLINWQPSIKTHTWATLLQAQRNFKGTTGQPLQIVTYQKERIRAKGATQRQQRRRHAIQDFSAVVEHALGLPPIPLAQAWPALAMPLNADRHVQLGIIPMVGNVRPNRAWPESYWHLLIQQLTDHLPGITLQVIGGPDATPIAQRHRAYPGVVDHTGQPLAETMRTLLACELVIGGDTGPTHLAAALGVPVVGIFGPTNPQRTGPIGPRVLPTITPLASLDCWPCERPMCPFTGHAEDLCLKQSTPDVVLAALLAYLETPAADKGAKISHNGDEP
jgi:heptosyltransferase-1